MMDQLNRICNLMGTPTQQHWPEGVRLAAQSQPPLRLPRCAPRNMAEVLPSQAPAQAINLTSLLLALNPQQRPSCKQALTHNFFAGFTDDMVSEPA